MSEPRTQSQELLARLVTVLDYKPQTIRVVMDDVEVLAFLRRLEQFEQKSRERRFMIPGAAP